LESLEELSCFGCGFKDIPAEICGEYELDFDALREIRAFYTDLKPGAQPDAEVKLFVLGNSGVGKTQLCRRLCGKPYDESVSSTHGVQVGHFTLDPGGDLPVVRVNFWDFGGQDIYHGSHALFLQGQAIFLLLWHPESEQGEFEQQGVRMRHRPLAYWLDYMRSLTDEVAPVLLIQSKCDDHRDKFELPTADLVGLSIHRLECSSKSGRGLDVLTAKLREAVGDLLREHPPHQIGRGRAAVRDRLRQMLAADLERLAAERQHRTVPWTEFDEMCAEAGDVSSPEALLAFLHRTGVVFHRRGLFGDRIILDQQWALDAVYTLLDRAKTLPALRKYGRFTRRDLEALAWQDYSEDDQETFLGMMEQCGICFRVRQLSHDEWEYAAPELLPEYTEVLRGLLAGRIPPGEADEKAAARYPFLHEWILRTFLSRLGTWAGDSAVYWKYGCWFYEGKTASPVLIRGQWDDADGRSGAGEVTLQAWGKKSDEVLETLLEELQKTQVGQPPTVTRSRLGPAPDNRPGGETRATGLERLRPGTPPDDGRKLVAISYAWGVEGSDGGRDRGRFVDDLHPKLVEWGYEVLRDCSQLKSGDLISQFMVTIGCSRRVIVVLSDKYLSSHYCMTELYYVFQRSLEQEKDFTDRIVPLILGGVRIDRWEDQSDWVGFWNAQREAMEKDGTNLSNPDLFHRVTKWCIDLTKILGFIANMLTVRGADVIAADDFSFVRRMLERPRQGR
jgi:internalin A